LFSSAAFAKSITLPRVRRPPCTMLSRSISCSSSSSSSSGSSY
jgi:hypothetical protein